MVLYLLEVDLSKYGQIKAYSLPFVHHDVFQIVIFGVISTTNGHYIDCWVTITLVWYQNYIKVNSLKYFEVSKWQGQQYNCIWRILVKSVTSNVIAFINFIMFSLLGWESSTDDGMGSPSNANVLPVGTRTAVIISVRWLIKFPTFWIKRSTKYFLVHFFGGENF